MSNDYLALYFAAPFCIAGLLLLLWSLCRVAAAYDDETDPHQDPENLGRH